MTQLTVPTLESQGDESTNDATTEIKLVQALDNKGSFVDKVVKTTYEHGETDPFVSTRAGVGTNITASSRIPRKTRLSRVMHSAPSPEDNAAAKSASELIDDWFTALHNPAARPVLKAGSNGTVRSGGVFLPPNVVRRALPETPTQSGGALLPPNAIRRALPETPTRQQSAKKSDAACFPPAKASPIRFSAGNPDDWQPLTVRKRAPSNSTRTTPAPVVENQEGGAQDEVKAEIMRLMAADLKDIHIQEEAVAVVRESNGATRRDADADTPRAKSSVSAGYVVEASPRSAPIEKSAAAARRGGRSVRPAV
jgi:hypothetical protein